MKRYNFEITTEKKIKLLKKNVKTNCFVCGKKINAYHKNGREQIVCSKECKIKSRRVLTNEQEHLLFEDYKINKMSYKNISKKYAIKRGTVGWIINKYKNTI